MPLPEMWHNSANKFFDALAAGKPVAINYQGWQGDLLESTGAGLVLPHHDPEEAARRLAAFVSNDEARRKASEAARTLAYQKFNRDDLASQFENVLCMAAKKNRSQLTEKEYCGKRAVDLTLALTSLIILSPLMLAIALLIWAHMGTPILFRQQRPGLHGKPFTLLKFRTMRDGRDESGRLLPDAERLTSLGKFLRRTSLDELPELINVLRGEMSLVGPRPLLMQYLDRYTPDQIRRHEVRPGITGWAQINGRNAITWEEKFALDLWYVEQASLILDLKILALTVWKVLRQDGISEQGQATIREFTGSQ
jgi:lipopolysaccharide/colanic/teichoic acid biosynthesis glycosyltransferase